MKNGRISVLMIGRKGYFSMVNKYRPWNLRKIKRENVKSHIILYSTYSIYMEIYKLVSYRSAYTEEVF
jgi:hypothetical protein